MHLNVARVPKGVRLGPTNRLKIAAERVTSRFLLSFPPFLSCLSSFSRSLFLSRSQFIEALGTCHLPAAHRGRAHSASTTAPATGITDGPLRRGRNSGEGAERRILWNISPHRPQFQNNARLKRRNVFQRNWRKKLYLSSTVLFWGGAENFPRDEDSRRRKDFFFVIISPNSKFV